METMNGNAELTPDWQRFTSGMHKILSVSKTEILRREAEYKKQSLANPNRRGPKLKQKA